MYSKRCLECGGVAYTDCDLCKQPCCRECGKPWHRTEVSRRYPVLSPRAYTYRVHYRVHHTCRKGVSPREAQRIAGRG